MTEYIFLSDDPNLPWKQAESEYVREFSRSLTPEEKEDCKLYIQYLNWPTQTHVQRWNRNLAVMCYVDGMRREKIKKMNLDPSYVTALFQVAVDEIAKWSGLTVESIRSMLPLKIYEKVRENVENKTSHS